MVPGTYWRSRWWSWAYSEGMSGLAMFAFLDVLLNLVTVYVIEGTYEVPYCWSKKRIEGTNGGIDGLTDVLKV